MKRRILTFLFACGLFILSSAFSVFADDKPINNNWFSNKVKYRIALSTDDDDKLSDVGGTIIFGNKDKVCSKCRVKIKRLSDPDKKIEDGITDENGRFILRLPDGDYELTPIHKNGNFKGEPKEVRIIEGKVHPDIILPIERIAPNSQNDRWTDESKRGTNGDEEEPDPMR